MEYKMNAQLYAETVRLNDRLLPTFQKISHDMTNQDVTSVGRSLLQIGADMRALLEKHKADNPERCTRLDNVKDATLRADAAAKAGNKNDTWAALMGAHGCINDVIVDVLGKMD